MLINKKITLIVSIIVLCLASLGFFIRTLAQSSNSCSIKPISTNTFIRTFHLLDLTDGFGISPTKNGGYLLTGDTIPAAGMAAPRPFIVKTDTKGNLSWSRWFGSQSLALGAMSSRRIARLTVETTDGNIVMVNDMLDFVDASYEKVRELYGDIFITKLNPKGNLLWSVMLGDYSEDRPQKIWALPDGGIIVLGRFFKTGYGNNIADTDAVARYSSLIKIDKNGKVLFTKKMDWTTEDMDRLEDGSFIALANVEVPKTKQPENILGPELIPHALPTIIKLDKNLNVAWAKSMEMIPSEINSPTSYASGTLTIGKTVIRMSGGDFRAIESTPDGGYIAFGFDNFALTQGLSGQLDTSSIGLFKPRPLVAVKVDAKGKYLWTKKLTNNLVSATSANDFQVIKTVDGQFVIMQDVIRDSANIEAKSKNAGQKRQAFLDKCKKLKSDCLDPAHIVAGAKQAASEDYTAMKILTEALASNIELIKTDAEFNPRWIKKYNAERDLSGYSIAPTADKGAVVAASLLTTKQHVVMMSLEPYKEATLIKIDTNGNTSGCANVSDQPKVAVEEQSQYLVMQNMNVGKIVDTKLKINKKVKEKISTIKNTARDICKYKINTIVPKCSYLTPDLSVSSSTPPSNSTSTPIAKTWALINFDNTKEVNIDSTRNQQIHNEILPILNQAFNNQVKMTSSMNGMWLTYCFPRLVTRADVETIQKKFEAIGYRIDESEGGRLYVSRIGLGLRMTFSTQDSMKGKVEVLF